MKGLTFKQLTEQKNQAIKKQNFELAAKLLDVIKVKFPIEYAFYQKRRKYNDTRKRKKTKERPVLMYRNLVHNLIRCGGKPIDADFMKELFL